MGPAVSLAYFNSIIFPHRLHPPSKESDNDTVTKIMKIFPIYSYCKIINVIQETRKRKLDNNVHFEVRKERSFCGELLIPEGSINRQVVTDFIEDGHILNASKLF